MFHHETAKLDSQRASSMWAGRFEASGVADGHLRPAGAAQNAALAGSPCCPPAAGYVTPGQKGRGERPAGFIYQVGWRGPRARGALAAWARMPDACIRTL